MGQKSELLFAHLAHGAPSLFLLPKHFLLFDTVFEVVLPIAAVFSDIVFSKL